MTKGLRMLPARTGKMALTLIVLLTMNAKPAHFQQFQQPRDQRSIGPGAQRTAQRMMGGYMRINTIATTDKMAMASAGDGPQKEAEKDEDTKTLSDQVKEGKYALIQNEIFTKQPKRPGVIGYESNPETASKDNNETLGGLKNNDIWLADGHLLVLKGGKYPMPGSKELPTRWPPIDNFEAPRRQVKLPKKPKVPPPFPVQLEDGGPIVFITSEGGRIPAPPLSPDGTPYPPPYPAFDPYPGDFAPGGAPYPLPPYPFVDFPRNESEGEPVYFPTPLPFAPTINGSFPGYPQPPPGLPWSQLPPLPRLPPINITDPDLYDEDDPSLYYPPPYSFSYKTDNKTKAEAGPLVPGIVLPPPPDFFRLDDESTKPPPKSTTAKTTTSTTTQFTTTKQTVPVQQIVPTIPPQPITVFIKQRPKPIELTRGFLPIAVKTSRPFADSPDNSIDFITTSTPRPFSLPVQALQNKFRRPESVVIIPKPIPQRTTDFPIKRPINRPSVSILYDIPDYNTNAVTQQRKPFLVYGLPRGQVEQSNFGSPYVTTTPVPLRAYYGPSTDQRPKLQPQYFQQNTQYFRPAKPNASPLASYYFYDELSKTTTPPPFYSKNQNTVENLFYETNSQGGFSPINNIDFKPLNQQGHSLFTLPQRQGSRTLTQEYFSVQQPNGQNNNYVSQLSTPDSFYKQIADIQQTIDQYTTPKPNTYYRPNFASYKQPTNLRSSSKPVYQYSFQSQGLPKQNGFRAPLLDKEPFRPMIGYSEPYDVQYRTTSKPPGYQQFLVETQTLTTENPLSNNYISTVRGQEFDYNDVSSVDKKQNTIKSNLKNTFLFREEVSNSHKPTERPGSKEERDFEEITRKYLTTFGKKLETATATAESVLDNAINALLDKDDKRVQSLEGDTLVNYRNPLPTINPDSEFVPIADPSLRARLEAERRFKLLRQQVEKERKQAARLHSQQSTHVDLSDDTAVNYRIPLPEINVDSEVVAASRDNAAGEGRPGSFVSYRLPGQGAHVYFLTPRASQPGTQGIR